MCHSRPAQRCWLRLPAPGGSRTDRAGGIPGRPARLGSARGRSMSDRTGLITLRGRPSRRRPQPDGGAAQWPRRQPAASSGGRCRRARRLLRRPRTRTKAAAGGSDRPAADNPHRPRGAPPTSSSSSGSSSSRTAVHCQLLRPCGRWLQFTAADRCRTLGAVSPRPQRSRALAWPCGEYRTGFLPQGTSSGRHVIGVRPPDSRAGPPGSMGTERGDWPGIPTDRPLGHLSSAPPPEKRRTGASAISASGARTGPERPASLPQLTLTSRAPRRPPVTAQWPSNGPTPV